MQILIFTFFITQVRHLYICDFHKNFIQSVRNKRKRKTSDDGGESPDHDVEVPEVFKAIKWFLILCCVISFYCIVCIVTLHGHVWSSERVMDVRLFPGSNWSSVVDDDHVHPQLKVP